MKKIAKLSLVAAVAVAGLTNVNAASLEEAIKGVDVSGQFRFRAQDIKSDSATDTNVNGTDVEIEVGVKVPVTENVTAVFKIDNANDDSENVTKAGVNIEDYYFSYNSGALTVNAGQQNIPGRLTDGAQGDGVVALYNLGNFTVGAASFITNSIGAANSAVSYAAAAGNTTTTTAAVEGVRDNDVNSIIAMGTVGPVSLLAQYVDLKDTANSYNLKADVKAGPVMVGAEYSETDMDANNDELTTLKAYVSGKMDIVSAKLTYAATGNNGSGSLHTAGDSSYANTAEVPAEFLLWQVGSAQKDDLNLWAADVSVAVTPAITLRAAYADGEYKVGTVDTDITETLGQISYKVSKNLSTYVRYSVKEDGAVDTNRGRVEARYSF